MPLVPSQLAASLQSDWLAHEGGGYADTAFQSGDRFAQAVSTWFGLAMAGPFPCSTADVRKGQLAASAGAALQAGHASLAGMQLALGLVGYMAGQVFGPGVAAPPTAASVAQSAITAALSNLELPPDARAEQIASATHSLAVSTVVVFPPVISAPVPVL